MNQTHEAHFKRIHILSLLIGLVGLLVSLYALITHLQILLKPGGKALCDINAQLNCSAVMSSSYGELASIPLGAYGMSYFIIILAAVFLPKISGVYQKQLALIELTIATIGFVSVATLFYISHFVLKVTCPSCTTIHILVAIYFVLKIRSFVSLRHQALKLDQDAFVKFFAISLCLGLPPLAAGLLAPFAMNYFVPEATASKTNSAPAAVPTAPKETQTTQVSPSPAPTTSTPELMTFNKTSYVGNGEDFRRGNDDAKVIVQMFSDFGCPHCKDANGELELAQNQVGQENVLLVYRFYPLDQKCNPFMPAKGWYTYSCDLAEATRCAGAQGKFWEFKEWAFLGQTWTNQERDQRFSLNGLKQQAEKLKMDVNLFSDCLQNGVERAKLKDDAALATKYKIQGTPMIFINGVEYKGPHSAGAFIRAFNQAQ